MRARRPQESKITIRIFIYATINLGPTYRLSSRLAHTEKELFDGRKTTGFSRKKTIFSSLLIKFFYLGVLREVTYLEEEQAKTKQVRQTGSM